MPLIAPGPSIVQSTTGRSTLATAAGIGVAVVTGVGVGSGVGAGVAVGLGDAVGVAAAVDDAAGGGAAEPHAPATTVATRATIVQRLLTPR